MIPEKVIGTRISLRGYRNDEREAASLFALIGRNQQMLEETGVLAGREDMGMVRDFLYRYSYEKGILKDKIVYAIVDNQTSELVGEIGAQQRAFESSVFLAYWMDKSFHRKGYMSEAYHLFQGVLKELSFHSVKACTYGNNEASKRFLMKHNFADITPEFASFCQFEKVNG